MADSYDPKAVRQKVLKDAVMHPATLGGLGLAGVGLLWTLVALSPLSILATVGGLALAGGSWYYNAVVQGAAHAQQHAASLVAKVVDDREKAMESLWSQCASEAFVAGATAATAFKDAYKQLLNFFRSSAHGKALDSYKIQVDQANQEAAGKVQLALNLFKALKEIDQAALSEEIIKLKMFAKMQPNLASEIQAKEAQLESLVETRTEIDALLKSVTDMASTLRTTYLDLVRLGNAGKLTEAEGGSAAAQLETVVKAARRKEQQLVTGTPVDPKIKAADDKYRQRAGQ